MKLHFLFYSFYFFQQVYDHNEYNHVLNITSWMLYQLSLTREMIKFLSKINEVWRLCNQSLEATDSLRNVHVIFSFFVHQGKRLKVQGQKKKKFKSLYALF